MALPVQLLSLFSDVPKSPASLQDFIQSQTEMTVSSAFS